MQWLSVRVLPLLAVLLLQFRVDVSLVTVGVQVEDSRGRDVRGLKAEDFAVSQDGVTQKIATFSSDPQPVTLGIVLDRSSSMEANSKIERAKEAAHALIRSAKEGSEFFYIEFSDKVRLASELTINRDEVSSAIQQTVADGGTSLYDAVLEGITTSGRAQRSRQALVIISDGADQHSTHELEEIAGILRESQIQVYTIGYFSQEEDRMYRTSQRKMTLTNGVEVDNPRVVLQKIAEESGALHFFPRSDEELVKSVEAISKDLATQYTLGFYPQLSGSTAEYRKLNVTVRGNGYRVRSRPGYGVRQFAPGTARPKTETSNAFESKVERRNGRMTYREDFADSKSGWPERENAQYTPQGYRLFGQDVVATAGPEFRNFRATVTVSMDQVVAANGELPRIGSQLPRNSVAPVPIGGGLVFRQAQASYYAIALFPATALQSGFAMAARVDGTKTTELGRWSLLNRPGRDRKLEVQCEGSTCAFYEGGALVGRLTNVATPQGRIGLVLRSRGEALFNNLSVVEIP